MSSNEILTDEYLSDMIKDYEKLLQLLVSINEHLLGNQTYKELKELVSEHQVQLDDLKQKFPKEQATKNEKTNTINSELIKKRRLLLENIELEEKKAKIKIQAGIESIKMEFTRIQELKRVYPNYQKPLENEARFIDNTK